MQEPGRIARGRSADQVPRGVVILALALFSWALLFGAWHALSLSFTFIAGT